MTVYLSQASQDENGNITGGKAGNQSGKELNTCAYYASSSNPWKVYRATDAALAKGIADNAGAAVKNKRIGYDQGNRNALLAAARRAGWSIANVSEDTETDCSALAAVCIICAAKGAHEAPLYAGNNLMTSATAGNKLMNTGVFASLGNLEQSDLRRGDILVRTGHVAVVTTAPAQSGAAASSKPTDPRYRVYTKEHGWLPWMQGLVSADGSGDDFAGEPGCWIYDFEWDAPAGSWFQLTLEGGEVLAKNQHNDAHEKAVIGITLYYVTPEPGVTGFYAAKYRVAEPGKDYYKFELDDQDDGAGGVGPIDRVQLMLEAV